MASSMSRANSQSVELVLSHAGVSHMGARVQREAPMCHLGVSSTGMHA